MLEKHALIEPANKCNVPGPMISVAHFFFFFRDLGGAQAVLHQHHALDGEHGMASRFVITHECESTPDDRVQFLGMDKPITVRRIQRLLERQRDAPQPLLAVYHSAPAMGTIICKLDQAARRVTMLHGTGDDLEENLRTRRDWLDGVISVSEQGRTAAQRVLSHLDAGRFVVLPLPISSCAGLTEHQPFGDRPVVIGYSGRLMKHHKRVDRLPELCHQLERLGVNYRLELLGDGPDRPWLEQQFAGNGRARILGRQSGAEYRWTLSTWDFIVFVSDTEGQPVSLLEAMSGGVIPVFPAIDSAGDAYVRKVDAHSLYAPGAVDQAAAAINWYGHASKEAIHRFRERCHAAVVANLDGTYFERFADFAGSILDLPRVSNNRFPWYPRVLNYFPMSMTSRLALVRRKLLRRLRR